MTIPTTPISTSPTWFAKNRTALLISLGFVAVVLLAGVLGANTPPPAWATIGQQLGHPLALIVDPVDNQSLYVGTEGGKVAHGTNNGASWTDLSKGLPTNIAVSALLQSADGQHFLAGTSAGVFTFNASTSTWVASSAGLPTNDGIDALAFGSQDAQIVLAGSEMNGLFRSTDGGKTWVAVSGSLPAHADIYGLTVTTDQKAAYAALIGGGIYLSTDAGLTWAALNTGLPAKVDVFTVVVRPASTKISTGPSRITNLFAGTNQGIYRSDDNGAHWVFSSAGLGSTRAISLSVDPLEPLFLLAGTDNGVYETTDGGSTWKALTGGIPRGQHVGVVAISHPTVNKETLYAAADQLFHYPGQTNSVAGILSRILIFGALIGALVWVGWRQRRTLQALTPKVPATAPKLTPKSTSSLRGPVIRPGTTSHIRGGPPPRPLTPNNDGEEEA